MKQAGHAFLEVSTKFTVVNRGVGGDAEPLHVVGSRKCGSELDVRFLAVRKRLKERLSPQHLVEIAVDTSGRLINRNLGHWTVKSPTGLGHCLQPLKQKAVVAQRGRGQCQQPSVDSHATEA